MTSCRVLIGHLAALAEDHGPGLLLHVEGVPLPHRRRQLHDVKQELSKPGDRKGECTLEVEMK